MMFGGLEKCTLIDYPGKTAAMVYTIGCNFRCPYCHNPELVYETVERRFGEAEILAFLDTRQGLLDGVVITGGEPTMHDDLLGFIKAVKARGFLVKLDTNGTRPAMLAALAERKLVDYIAMDMKAPLRKYSRTVGRPVDTGAIKESIELLLQGLVDYEFRTTLVKALLSPEDIREIGKEIRGAKAYYLQRFVPTKLLNPQFRRKVTYTDDELTQLQHELSEYVPSCGIR
jgi:pyruvate formate lyase activating enzyme